MIDPFEQKRWTDQDQITAEVRRFADEQQLPAAFRNDLHAGIMVDEEMKSQVIRLSVDILTHRVATITRRWPMNWKEALKERFAPRWLLARWPVRYTTLTVTADELFPHLSMPRPKKITIPISRLTSTETVGTGDDTDE